MKNKNLVGDIIQVKKIKVNGGQVRPTTKKQKSTRDLLIEFMGEQREFNKTVMQRFENIENRLDKHDKRFENIENRLDKHDKRFENIEHELSI